MWWRSILRPCRTHAACSSSIRTTSHASRVRARRKYSTRFTRRCARRSDPVSDAAPQGRLAQNIVYFARALRAAGIPVGPGAVLDALSAVTAAGVGTRDDFYWTLHAV